MSKNSIFLIFIIPIVIYFRGFAIGVLINSLLLIHFFWCLIIVILEFLMILLITKSLNLYTINNQKIIILITFCIFIYSLILEIVGDKFG